MGASVMFYKMFLDPDVARELHEYDALAIIEWDVLVAHHTSFSRLYETAFCSEPFWVKGSTLAGTEFHQTATVRDMWHVLGHLNGNAIYNNTDPAFTQFVNYTLTRWGYSYSYDVALWATISDFPYSWLLWQRYSTRFIATKLITNVGFFDVNDTHVADAILQETLFIHGSTASGGNVAKPTPKAIPARYSSTCMDACSSVHSPGLPAGMSTVCDESCFSGWSPAGPRFRGHNCGAGDPSLYGSTCRSCYTDEEEALAADRSLGNASSDPFRAGAHVIMCDTGEPPQASSCSPACRSMADTVCDSRCGTGLYGDFNCDWLGLGLTCRRCFEETSRSGVHAGNARGCSNTSEGFPSIQQVRTLSQAILPIQEEEVSKHVRNSRIFLNHAQHDCLRLVNRHIANTKRDPVATLPPNTQVFLTQSEIFRVVGYLNEVEVECFCSVFNRRIELERLTLGYLPDVTIGNASSVEHGALIADQICGNGTRLIYYMNVGEVLSRTFTRKDTHGIQGDLVVSATDSAQVPLEHARRAAGSAVLLGFTTPSFTYGTDLILPAETNGQLRAVLHTKEKLNELVVVQAQGKHRRSRRKLGFMFEYLASVAHSHRDSATIYIPEVLAALAHSRRASGVTFLDMHHWSRKNLFSDASIWDIPLVKPRFGCAFDTSLSLKGYDMASVIAKELEAFKFGASCELGFESVEISELSVKADWEFGAKGTNQSMPSLHEYNVTVLYQAVAAHEALFKISIATVIEHFSSAFEVVVLVIDADVALFEGIVNPFRATSPFPLRVVGEPELMDGTVQQTYSKLRADLYANGEYVLHLDSDAVLFEDVTYAHMFHLGKPVLPFRRYGKNGGGEGKVTICWQRGTSVAIGEDVIHEFSIFNTNVYPRHMYPAARRFIEEHHGLSFTEFMGTRRASCAYPDETARLTADERIVMFSFFNFVGAYLW
ncbi:unnamed protein product [Ectocarpus sp. 8 AP-2014]